MRRTVEVSKGVFEELDFIPVNTLNTPSYYSENDKDYLFNHVDSYVDHTKPAPVYRTVKLQNLASQIYSRDLSDFIEPQSQYENPCDRLFRSTFRHGDFAPYMVKAFTNILERKDFYTALHMVERADRRLRADGIRRTRTDEEIIELAKAKSKAFSKELILIECEFERFNKAASLIATLGLAFRPSLVKEKADKLELESLTKRACCEIWLRRQLRRAYFSEVEAVARDLMLIHKTQDAYCSQHSVDNYKLRQSDTEQALLNTVCYLEDDQDTWFTLQELAAKSTSNPTIRRAEMFVRLRAFEEIAKDSGHVALFYTVTTPSRFHVYKGDDFNPAWVEAGRPSARDAHAHLLSVTDAFRKSIDKKGIKLYGLRIVEPHHDGTPHSHFLFFARKEDEPVVTQLMRESALADSPDEAGAKRYRFKREIIDWNRGSAVGYVAKYLSKNIDGQHIDTDKSTSLSGDDTSTAVVSFNRIHGIRQFQFYGGPSVTAWRELRRFRSEFKEHDAIIVQNGYSSDQHLQLETLRHAADSGDFRNFVQAMGGVFVRRKDQSIRVVYNKKLTADALMRQTRYGDEVAATISGILFQEKFIRTRFALWRFERKSQFVLARQKIRGSVNSILDFEEQLSIRLEAYEHAQERYDELVDVDPFELFMECASEYHDISSPPDVCPSWAQPDWDTHLGPLDLCH